ncbi:hypothetical protein BKA67DRAFT_538048 [Truncatella angustata]|uniref:Uncharacterized protein n=1 Tax=Truncatella angustata TaxID=152316 RepID=A0A9P8UH27_9PEZI|nr:uncharacterized protein BKA67DRAFT_538048 [Truncatella angustata]KAH6652222.1 hypothetical protein BKA67DRAFT_538048 [Truncatella angustata]
MPPRGTKRPRRLHCDGEGCGDPDCSRCWGSADDGDAPTVGAWTEVVDLTKDVDVAGGGVRRGAGPPRRQPSGDHKSLRIMSPAKTTVGKDAPGFQAMVDALDDKTVRDTLVRLASMAPSAQTAIKQAYNSQLRECELRADEKPLEPLDVDHYSKKAWHALYTSDAAKRWETFDEVRRLGAKKRATDAIAGYVKEIRQKIRETTPFDDKLCALETIRKIFKSILLGSNELAKSVRAHICDTRSPEIGGHVMHILLVMSNEEVLRARGTADEKGTLIQKFWWCWNESKRYNLLEFQNMIHTIMVVMGGGEDNDLARF